MDLTKLNRISATAPVIMSLGALALLLFSLFTGWERVLMDEGAVAHMFQLLIALQAPLIAVFLATADWRRLPAIVRVGACQAGALVLALAPVALLRL